MLKLPSEELITLIESVLAKHQWTQSRLAQELNLGPETISRWRGGAGIHKGHHEELKRLAKDSEPMPEPAQTSQISIPFTVTILRKDLQVMTDRNGDFIVKGILRGMLNKEE